MKQCTAWNTDKDACVMLLLSKIPLYHSLHPCMRCFVDSFHPFVACWTTSCWTNFLKKTPTREKLSCLGRVRRLILTWLAGRLYFQATKHPKRVLTRQFDLLASLVHAVRLVTLKWQKAEHLVNRKVRRRRFFCGRVRHG